MEKHGWDLITSGKIKQVLGLKDQSVKSTKGSTQMNLSSKVSKKSTL